MGLLWRIECLHHGNRNQTTDLVESTEETELSSLGVVEELLPRAEVLDRVEEHSVQGQR